MAMEIAIEAAAPEGIDELITMGQQADTAFFEALAPVGPFTIKAVNPLIKAMNGILPLFGLDPSLEEITDRLMPTSSGIYT